MKLLTALPGIDFRWYENGSFSIRGQFAPGLYRFTLFTTIAAAEWERFYYPMTSHAGQIVRTGPWDFDGRNCSRPLVPAWWITRNDRRVGLFYLNRPDLSALETRNLTGTFGFQVCDGDDLSLEATPYAPFTLEPQAATLEKNVDDRLTPQPWAQRGFAVNWLHALGQERLATCRVGASDDANDVGEALLREACRRYRHEYVPPKTSDGSNVLAQPVDALPCLAFAHQRFSDHDCLNDALKIVRHYLELPAWGRLETDSYGHNCDMFCATIIKNLVVALNWLDDDLGPLKDALSRRLDQQIEQFLELQLLHANYWGGALAQDHGYRSTLNLAFASLGMLGWSEHAARWLAFYLPRVQRCVDTLPHDGFIPFTNYHSLSLYGLDAADLAQAWEFATGHQLFQESTAFRHAPQALLSNYCPKTRSHLICCTRGDRKRFDVGLSFMNVHSRQTGSSTAAYFSEQLWVAYKANGFGVGRDGRTVWKACATLPFALLAQTDAQANEVIPGSGIALFPDGGALHYRSPDATLAVAAYCLPPGPSFHAIGGSLTPTDCLTPNPAAGHFSVTVDGEVLLQNAESGYRTASNLSNVLLVNGRGQIGDVGYPGAVQSRRWSGARMLWANDNAARFSLAPAYPPAAGLRHYTRDLTFTDQQIVLLDTIISDDAALFEYHFQTYASRTVTIEQGRVFITGQNSSLQVRFDDINWQAELGETDVVWAYGNDQDEQGFQHIRFYSRTRLKSAQLKLTMCGNGQCTTAVQPAQ